jgi:hypothetical protein
MYAFRATATMTSATSAGCPRRPTGTHDRLGQQERRAQVDGHHVVPGRDVDIV